MTEKQCRAYMKNLVKDPKVRLIKDYLMNFNPARTTTQNAKDKWKMLSNLIINESKEDYDINRVYARYQFQFQFKGLLKPLNRQLSLEKKKSKHKKKSSLQDDDSIEAKERERRLAIVDKDNKLRSQITEMLI